ncbi:hypothetical protein Ancab_009874 [Ancistrocladus abbreviatus]
MLKNVLPRPELLTMRVALEAKQDFKLVIRKIDVLKRWIDILVGKLLRWYGLSSVATGQCMGSIGLVLVEFFEGMMLGGWVILQREWGTVQPWQRSVGGFLVGLILARDLGMRKLNRV